MRAEVEMEGGGSTWWYVCGECHGAINYQADICPHCKAVLSWEGFGLPARPKNYHGELAKDSDGRRETDDKGSGTGISMGKGTAEHLRIMTRDVMEAAKTLRSTAPRISFMLWRYADLGEEAAGIIDRQTAPVEIEGATTWWYICGECRGQIDRDDHFCRHCGWVLDGSQWKVSE